MDFSPRAGVSIDFPEDCAAARTLTEKVFNPVMKEKAESESLQMRQALPARARALYFVGLAGAKQ